MSDYAMNARALQARDDATSGAAPQPSRRSPRQSRQWWRRGTIYQVYPLSFQDSTGNGKGDLNGIRRRLDYLQWLGVDAVWLSPIYPSPMKDCGYDVADYCDIARDFGSLEDFDALLGDVHARGMKLILDLVPNHTSSAHPWFRESRASRSSDRRDWYIWRDPAPDGGPPNNWLSVFGGSAWKWDAQTGQYYYHAFLEDQPDLNWRNRRVREAMYDIMRIWLDRGVDGFRIDVLWHLVKDEHLRDDLPNPDYRAGDPEYRRLLHVHSCDRPEIHEVVAEMRAVCNEYLDRVLIGEIYLPVDRLVAYYGLERPGVHLPFNFQLIQAPWDAAHIERLIVEYERLVPEGEWPNWVLGNHDQSRIATRVGEAQARVAAMLLLTLRGTPTIYYGDELGMEDVRIAPHQVRDPHEKNEPGIGAGRDPQRTPMPWSAAPHAGFTAGEPWLPLGCDHGTRNVEQLARDPRSIMRLYRRLIGLRRAHPALSMGNYRELFCAGALMVYERSWRGARCVVALNFSHEPATVLLPAVRGELLESTHLDRAGESICGHCALRGDEGVVIGVCGPDAATK